jgi:hypothetical protein
LVPDHCPVPMVLCFLQSLLDNNRAPSTLKVYVAAISAQHVKVNDQSLGSHILITRVLKGAQRLHTAPTVRVPSWDLSLVLRTLTQHPFEPMEHCDLKWLSIKTGFLLAITSAKRVGELYALSTNTSCMRWNADGTMVTLWPNPSFLPKRLSTSFRNQPIELVALNRSVSDTQEGNPMEQVCPVRALRGYLSATEKLRRSDQLSLLRRAKKRAASVKAEVITLGGGGHCPGI